MKLSSPVGCQLSLSFPSFSAFLGLFLLAMLSTWVCIVVGGPQPMGPGLFPFFPEVKQGGPPAFNTHPPQV